MTSTPLPNISTIPFSIATVSVGTTRTSLPDKLRAISSANFTGIELGFPDLLSYASSYLSRRIEDDDYASLAQAAQDVHRLAASYGLTIMMLQPFSNFEGWGAGSKERDAAFRRAKGWIKVMKALGTDMLQVGSSDSEGIEGKEAAVRDLKELGGMLEEEGCRLAYEPWCWASVCPTWRDCWEVVKAVDLPNVGLCLDTFQICGGEYADPTTDSGIKHGLSSQELGRQFAESLDELSRTVAGDKIFLLQISDAYVCQPPLVDESIDGLRPKGRWSHDFRPLPFGGGYLPVKEVCKEVLKTGARSWWSVEVFDSGVDGKKDRDSGVSEFCGRAMGSVKRLLEESLAMQV